MNIMQVKYTLPFILGYILVLGLFPTQAQGQEQENEWESLTPIYFSSYIDSPTLASDVSGTLHVLWWGRTAEHVDDALSAILYSRLNDGQWTSSTDVLISPNGDDSRYPGAVVDTDGILHVIWGGPQLYYSQAPAWAAERPQNWSSPQEIGEGRIVVSPPGIEIAPDGTIHVVFAAGGDEIYHLASVDGSETWTMPNAVSLSPPETGTMTARLSIDRDGTLHTVWTQIPLPEGYPPLGIFYSKSDDGGATWTETQKLTGPDYGEATIAVANNNTIHVAYNGRAGVGGKYHRWSINGGETWSEPATIRLPRTGGLDGYPGLVVDSSNTLYFIGGGEGGAWYSEWHGSDWSPVQNLRDLASTPLDYIEQPALSITAGNQLHAVFWDGRQRLWHTQRYLAAPVQKSIPYPTLTPNDILQQPEEVVALQTETPRIQILEEDMQYSDTNTPMKASLTGIISTTLIVISITTILLVRRRP